MFETLSILSTKEKMRGKKTKAARRAWLTSPIDSSQHIFYDYKYIFKNLV